MCYEVSPGVPRLMRGRLAELIVIDGPAGAPGIRFGTIPLVQQLTARDAPFLLDDALRAGEIEVATRWSQLPYLKVNHTILVDKGVLSGTVHPIRGSSPASKRE